MATKITFIGAAPSETTGADVVSNGPHTPATLDQNLANLRSAVDRIMLNGTKVVGLNADQIDGFHVSQSGAASSVIPTDANGNFGLGCAPSTQYSTVRAIQLGSTGRTSLWDSSGTYTNLGNNCATPGNEVYIASDVATLYRQNGGKHIWCTAAAGTAGANITWIQGMTLDAASSLLINTATSDGVNKLQVNGGIAFAPTTTTTAPAAGGAGALPATPLGYATVTINGTARKIPYYA